MGIKHEQMCAGVVFAPCFGVRNKISFFPVFIYLFLLERVAATLINRGNPLNNPL